MHLAQIWKLNLDLLANRNSVVILLVIYLDLYFYLFEYLINCEIFCFVEMLYSSILFKENGYGISLVVIISELPKKKCQKSI